MNYIRFNQLVSKLFFNINLMKYDYANIFLFLNAFTFNMFISFRYVTVEHTFQVPERTTKIIEQIYIFKKKNYL